jgi:phosphoribosylformimino-5-aminoimidazole carboxamide ribonucleotide (ProFAR) isomerase
MPDQLHIADDFAGPNVELYRAVTRATTAPVIASGGVSAIGDLVALAEVAAAGANLEGAVVGRALHAGRFTLPEALEAMRRPVSPDIVPFPGSAGRVTGWGGR